MNIDAFTWGILERRRIAIFPVALLMYAYTSRLKPLVGKNHRHFIMSYSHGFLTAFKDESDWRSVSTEVYAHVRRHPDCIKDIAWTFEGKAAELIEHTKRMEAFDGDIAGEAAANLYKTYCDLYVDASVYGECVPYTIKERLAEELHDRLSKFDNGPEILSVITVPPCPSFTMREEINFLKRLKAYKAPGGDKENIVRRHHADYCWTTYDYDGEGWSLDEIRNKFDSHADMDHGEIASRIFNLDLFMERSRQDERECIARHGIDESITTLSQILKDSMGLMDVKKEYLTRAHHHTCDFFRKAANHLCVERKLLSYIVPYEFSDMMKRRDADMLAKRYDDSSVYISEGGWTFVDVPKAVSELAGEAGNGTTVKGHCAYPGKVRGTVHIVKTVEDIKAFRDGEVLVATVTTVDFIEAMKRASAIVTDDGGVICHAAIISREMKIPCIVGSRCATNTYVGGDVVAVDADNGVVTLADGGSRDL